MYCARCGFRLEEHHYACPVCFPATRKREATFEVAVKPSPLPKGASGIPASPSAAPATPVPRVPPPESPVRAPPPAPRPAVAVVAPPVVEAPVPAPPVKRVDSGYGFLRSTAIGLAGSAGNLVLSFVPLLPLVPVLMRNGASVALYAVATFALGIGLVVGGVRVAGRPRRRTWKVAVAISSVLGWLVYGVFMTEVVTTSSFGTVFILPALLIAPAFYGGSILFGLAMAERRYVRTAVSAALAAWGITAVLAGLGASFDSQNLQDFADRRRAVPGADFLALAIAALVAVVARRGSGAIGVARARLRDFALGVRGRRGRE